MSLMCRYVLPFLRRADHCISCRKERIFWLSEGWLSFFKQISWGCLGTKCCSSLMPFELKYVLGTEKISRWSYWEYFTWELNCLYNLRNTVSCHLCFVWRTELRYYWRWAIDLVRRKSGEETVGLPFGQACCKCFLCTTSFKPLGSPLQEVTFAVSREERES